MKVHTRAISALAILCASALAAGQPPAQPAARSLADDLKALEGGWELPVKGDGKDGVTERSFRLTLKDGIGLLAITTKRGPDGAGLLGGISQKEYHFEYTLARGGRARLLLATFSSSSPWEEGTSVVRCEIDGAKIKLKGPLKVSSIKSENIDVTGEWTAAAKK